MRDKLPEGDRRTEMPQGRRGVDQGKRHQPRHWLAVRTSRHPVGMALIVAIIVAMIPVTMLLDQQGTLSAQQAQLDEQQESLNGVVQRTNRGRAATSNVFCRTINRNGSANNNQTAVIQKLLISGVQASRAFENLYVAYGQPPYRERLKSARRAARELDKNRVNILNCATYSRRIENELRPRPPVSKPHIGRPNP